MIRVTSVDFHKLLKLLAKEGQEGATLTFRDQGNKLEITTVDRANKTMIVEISDSEYPFMPRLTKTETF